ncbi:MAG TPA: hypothetical protein VFP48_02145 [Steroidobacteraceae bacterium]|nr:hypothetical protein [Steroidobacteraceae bacterium]
MTTRVLDSHSRGGRAHRSSVRALSTLLLFGMTGCACSRADLDTQHTAAAGGAEKAETAPMANVPSPMLEAALDDATRRTSTERAAIDVVFAGPVTWSDGSLGCPEPGMMYTQALVPGYRIVLRAGAQVLNYHAGRSGEARFCPPEQVIPPAEGGGADRM